MGRLADGPERRDNVKIERLRPRRAEPEIVTDLEFIATTAFGLEAVTAQELRRLGYESRTTGPGRVLFKADAAALARSNLWLRTADRVLLRMDAFSATDFGQLFDQTYALPWEAWLPTDALFPVTGRSHKSQLSSVPACQKIVKKAIVEKLRAAHGVTELPETGPRYKVDVALLANEATLTIDTSGPGLHKRGYRTLTGPAPLKETLAAALLLLAHWRPELPLIDPFCGTGTIPIEAALLGRNLAPGRLRTFDAEAWPSYEARYWTEARQEAADLALKELPVRILGTDRDEAALSMARYHAKQAAVADDIHFQVKEFGDLTSKRQYGMVVTNPPYGLRLGVEEEAADIVRQMPDILRRLPTWSHFILSAAPNFEELVGQRATRRRKLYNGRIQCTYFQFYGPRPSTRRAEGVSPWRSGADEDLAAEESEAPPQSTEYGVPSTEYFVLSTEYPAESDEIQEQVPGVSSPRPAQVPEETLEPASDVASPRPHSAPRPRPEPKPAFGGLPTRATDQAMLFHNRLTKLARHLRRWPTKQGITCYRLYDRDIPEVPLVVDRYENYLHVAEFERPNEHTLAEHGDWIDLMLDTAAETLEVPRDHVFCKRRERQRDMGQYERQAAEQHTTIANEGGLKFLINLSDYVDTGLFLDHRVTRGMVRDQAAGKRFLNLFCYTGAFTVYAAAAGAASTTSVDLSNTYLDWAKKNLNINNLLGEQHRLVRRDTLGFLRDHAPGEHYDLAVADVPTYSRSKATEEDWDVQRDYPELLGRLLDLMPPGGVVYFSSNFRRLKFDETAVPQATAREISRQTVPPDFRNKRIHRAWRLVKKPASR